MYVCVSQRTLLTLAVDHYTGKVDTGISTALFAKLMKNPWNIFLHVQMV